MQPQYYGQLLIGLLVSVMAGCTAVPQSEPPMVWHEQYGAVRANDSRFEQDAEACAEQLEAMNIDGIPVNASAKKVSEMLDILVGSNALTQGLQASQAMASLRQTLQSAATCLVAKGWSASP